MSSSSSEPQSSVQTSTAGTSGSIRRVAILFAGGPVPAANAVISTAAASFLRHGIEVIGVLHGYSHLMEFGDDHPMVEGRDYVVLNRARLKRSRNTPGSSSARPAPIQGKMSRIRATLPMSNEPST